LSGQYADLCEIDLSISVRIFLHSLKVFAFALIRPGGHVTVHSKLVGASGVRAQILKVRFWSTAGAADSARKVCCGESRRSQSNGRTRVFDPKRTLVARWWQQIQLIHCAFLGGAYGSTWVDAISVGSIKHTVTMVSY